MKYILGEWDSKVQLIKWDTSYWSSYKNDKAYYIGLGKYMLLIKRKVRK